MRRTHLVALLVASISAQNATWQKLSDGPWSAREGLMAVETPAGIVMTGGRDLFGAAATRDVWVTKDGSKWEKQAQAPFKARAYHAMFYAQGCVFVAGGQTISLIGAPYYNDVWKSCDGLQTWHPLGHAPWRPRAGIAFTSFGSDQMIIAGGCYGEGQGPGRKFLNDVWSSTDGTNWTILTDNAPWPARSGARLVEFDGKLILLAGEIGFTPQTQLGDVWSSSDGVHWTLLTPTPSFSKRSGHGVVVVGTELLVIAGWHANKCLHDLWKSSDGVTWHMVSNTSWNCQADSCGKFDFWPVVTSAGTVLTLGGSNAYSTFGKLWADTWALAMPALGEKAVLASQSKD